MVADGMIQNHRVITAILQLEYYQVVLNLLQISSVRQGGGCEGRSRHDGDDDHGAYAIDAVPPTAPQPLLQRFALFV